MAHNAKEWVEGFARELGTEAPTAKEFATLLDVAAEAAHASERVAAPVACWVSARAGASPDEALAAARRVSGAAGDAGGGGGSPA